jgi:hypothetical protein
MLNKVLIYFWIFTNLFYHSWPFFSTYISLLCTLFKTKYSTMVRQTHRHTDRFISNITLSTHVSVCSLVRYTCYCVKCGNCTVLHCNIAKSACAFLATQILSISLSCNIMCTGHNPFR